MISIFRGFKFGMLLQLAIGPVCIFIFQIASLKGFYIAEKGVVGVALIDGIYIIVAILGIATIIDRKNVRVCLKIFGAIILFVFGLSTISSQFNISLIPSLNLQNTSSSNNMFTNAIILTASNPLTIIFWAGVFGTEISEENMKRNDVYLFGIGALLSTILFLTLIALMGSFAKSFLSTNVIQILNIFVGFLLIYFSIKMILKKDTDQLKENL